MANSSDSGAKVQYLTVDENAEGQRIDNFLMARLKGVPKSWVYRVLRKGEVRVNKGRAKPTRKLEIGDEVRVPPVRRSDDKALTPGTGMQQAITDNILYEDDLLLIVNKPSGMAVHGGSGVSHGVIEALRAARPDAKFLELAHRLDRDTSGCLMLAKKRSSLKELQRLQVTNQVDKRYQALLDGRWRKGKQTVDVPLQKNTLKSGERMVRVDPEGKKAITHFTVLQHFSSSTLVEAKLETGRTHQIRVHAQYAGTPIVGDTKYETPDALAYWNEQGVKRLFLHAWRLSFPWEGKRFQIEAPLPAELQSVLEGISE